LTGGTNLNSTLFFKDLWSYDPNSQQWQLKAAYPTNILPSPIVSCFAIGNKGYIFGRNDSPQFGTNYFLEYDPSQNSYSSKSIPATFSSAASFSLCSNGYLVTGAGTKGVFRYEPDISGAIGGPRNVCGSFDAQFTLQSLGTGVITWTTSSNIYIVSGQGTGTINARSNSSGNGWVAASINLGCRVVQFPQYLVTAGTPTPNGIIGPDYDLCRSRGGSNNSGDFYIPNPIPNLLYQWQVVQANGQTQPAGSGTSVTLLGSRYPVGYHTIRVRSYSCNTYSPWYEASFGVIDCQSGLRQMIYPNPASNELIVETEQDSVIQSPVNVILFDEKQEIVFKEKTTQEKIKIPVLHLPNGTYYLNITNGDRIIQKRVNIKH
jgi:hypothetical protein